MFAHRMAPRYELAVGLNRGHKTTKIRVAKNKSEKEKTLCIRPARLKGVSIMWKIVRFLIVILRCILSINLYLFYNPLNKHLNISLHTNPSLILFISETNQTQ